MQEKTQNQNNKNESITQDIINLVISRLETIPSNVTVSIGDEGNFSVEELIKRVKNGDDIGKKMIEMQLAYLRSLSHLQPQEKNVAPNH